MVMVSGGRGTSGAGAGSGVDSPAAAAATGTSGRAGAIPMVPLGRFEGGGAVDVRAGVGGFGGVLAAFASRTRPSAACKVSSRRITSVGSASDPGASGGVGGAGGTVLIPDGAGAADRSVSSASASSARTSSPTPSTGCHWVVPAGATCAAFGTRPAASPRTRCSVATGPTCAPSAW